MEKTNLKLSALIETMREIASEGNRFVKGDSFHDVVRITKEAEDIEDFDIEEEYKEGEWNWCLRKNGTFIGSLSDFEEEFDNEAVAAYKIKYSNRRFSIALIKKYSNEFFD